MGIIYENFPKSKRHRDAITYALQQLKNYEISLPKDAKKKSSITIGKCFIFLLILLLVVGYVILVIRGSNQNDSGNANDKILEDNELGQLYSNVSGVCINQSEDVLFFVKATVNEESKIELYRDDEKIGQLNDDGQNGDRKANDGCYSVEITISPTDEIEFYSFNVILGECTSNEVKVYVYDEITDEDCDVSAEVLNLLTEIENKYKNGQGYVDYENYSTVIEEMSSCVENYSAENNVSIIAMEKDTNGLFITFSSGIQVMYILSQPKRKTLCKYYMKSFFCI